MRCLVRGVQLDGVAVHLGGLLHLSPLLEQVAHVVHAPRPRRRVVIGRLLLPPGYSSARETGHDVRQRPESPPRNVSTSVCVPGADCPVGGSDRRLFASRFLFWGGVIATLIVMTSTSDCTGGWKPARQADGGGGRDHEGRRAHGAWARLVRQRVLSIHQSVPANNPRTGWPRVRATLASSS